MRNAAETRHKLLRAAYEQMHAHGFQGMRVDQVLKQAGLQKGAFYHHFNSKTELGYAVVEEEIISILESVWFTRIERIVDPVKDIPLMLEKMSEYSTPLMREHGCPLNNLAQEMSKLDEGFHQRVEAGFELWISTLANKLEETKNNGYLRADVDTQQVARFIVAVIEGCISLGKAAQKENQPDAYVNQTRSYLKALQA